MDNNSLAIFLGAFTSIMLICLVLGLVLYILSALGLKKIAEKNGVSNSFFAWIPILNNYLMGKMAFKSIVTTIIFVSGQVLIFVLSMFSTISLGPTMNYSTYQNTSTYVSNTVTVNSGSLSFLSLLLAILSIVISVMFFVALYRIYKKMSTNAVIMIVFSILFPILIPIFLFAIRNNPVRSDV